MKVVILVIVLTFIPDTWTIHVLTPNMTACQAARRSLPSSMEVEMDGVLRKAKVVRAKCERIDSRVVKNGKGKIQLGQIE